MSRWILPLFLALLNVAPAQAQSDRVVALVISVGEGSARADAIQAQFHANNGIAVSRPATTLTR